MMSTADASPDAATLGDANAEVTIIEYASVTCPHCATFHETLFPHIKENWIDTGRAKLVMRPLPTQPAQLAVAGFLLASCAGEGEDYFEVLDALFTTQDAMFAAAQDGTIQAYFEGVGADHGVTPEAFEMCLGDEARLAQINASMLASDADMVTGTPSFVINGTPHGADELATPESWDAALQAAEDAQ
jgi:protein-disulfide isomerase